MSFHLTVRVLIRIPEFFKTTSLLPCNIIFFTTISYNVLHKCFFYPCQFKMVTYFFVPDCEWKAQAGNACVASFDWTCSGICNSVERMLDVHQRCGEGDDAVWSTIA